MECLQINNLKSNLTREVSRPLASQEIHHLLRGPKYTAVYISARISPCHVPVHSSAHPHNL
jgi:hypothetical protein